MAGISLLSVFITQGLVFGFCCTPPCSLHNVLTTETLAVMPFCLKQDAFNVSVMQAGVNLCIFAVTIREKIPTVSMLLSFDSSKRHDNTEKKGRVALMLRRI